MSSILDKKLENLENSNLYECWYLVKQPTDFSSLCYLVSFLEDYKKENLGTNLSTYINTRVDSLNSAKGLNISKNYRALRVAVYFGLIKMIDGKYENSKTTETFEEINEITDGDFEKKDLYSHIITRQIEKIFISSSIDEEYERVRKEYRLFPVILLYKILLELGRSNKSDYSITINEYRYLVATTKNYEDYLDTLLEIIELRNNPEYNVQFQQYKDKFDNRMNHALAQLDTIVFGADEISISPEKINEVDEKVSAFENSSLEFSEFDYLDFLGSTDSLLDLLSNSKDEKFIKNNSIFRIIGGDNILLYGVPGSGKSHTIKDEYCDDESKIERIVFHPDYMNTDFIGQILPTINEDKSVSYSFNAGPFTRILKKSYEDKEHHYYLIIEEINRGNAPAIFGDIFQLLDRDSDGNSTYFINNENISKWVYGESGHPIWIPSNLTILATMNTADQNVFTLDTAFQRRWNMKLIKNDVSSAKHSNKQILDTGVTWKSFNKTINKFILENSSSKMSSEDKRLGAYFITEEVLDSKETSLFAEKVLKYLWDDAFKFTRNKVFVSDYTSLEQIVEFFENNKGFDRFNIFLSDVREEFEENKEKKVIDSESIINEEVDTKIED
ncbi:AAA family ATPase [Anaerococcus sp.]|uniref:AAA family ATPase n=1 Tax=Anaerococcus sp. TaxID=1872515 RepID=UPI00280B81FB|nr:AAA family ATPase [Anaerococcus sp.]MDU3176668.1 AAA family ATPase [Anaerococcus sp.]